MEQSNDYFIQKQFEIMLDINNKKIAAEFNKMSDAITSLQQEMNDLKRQIKQNRLSEQKLPAPKPASNEIKTTGKRPAYTDYKSGEISVEKFFYCGRK